MTCTALKTTVLLLALALTGCDDVLLFDVAADGRILAPIDREGRVTGLGDAAAPRHLAVIDPTTGEVSRFSREPQVMSWPRWCGAKDVVLIEGRARLVHLAPDGTRRVLFESDRRLLQPTPSPTGDRVAVLEVEQPGLPGRLHVIDVATGQAGAPFGGAILGFAWAGDALVIPRLVGRAETDEVRPFEGGPGEVFVADGAERRLLFRGRLPGATWLAPVPGGEDVVALLSRDEPGALTLAGLSLARPGAAAAVPAEGLDLWPSVDAQGRALFTRSRPGRATLEGELRLTRAGALGASTRIKTPGPVCAPRWTGERVAYLTPDDHLVTQDLDGGGLVDWTDRLAALSGDLP